MRKIAFGTLLAALLLTLGAWWTCGNNGLIAQARAAAATPTDAPAFTLPDQDGKPYTLADYADKVVVLEWTNPQCPIDQRVYQDKIMTTTQEKYAAKGVVWLAINSTSFADKEENKRWSADHGMTYPMLDDHEGTVGHAYGAKTTPHMFIIAQGKIVYHGAIDNDPRGNKKADDRVNYVAQALDEVLAGKDVSTPATTPYGCTVKYKD